jgi:putative flippase GtrA
MEFAVMQHFHNLWSRRGTRYLLVGVVVYIFELAVIFWAQALGMSAVAAVALSFWLGLVLSFALQKLVTFQDKRLHYRLLSLQVAIFALLVLWNFGFTLAVTWALSGTMPAFISRSLALALTTIWNFYLYKTRIFSLKPGIIT